jgi:phosphate-selective porin OprO and OprP
MRHTLLALAVGAVLIGNSASASAQSRDAEIQALKAQIEALMEKVESLEERSDAQSEVNVDTAQKLDDIATKTPKVETKGGIKITSADGKFEANVSGRVHFDTYAFDRDIVDTTGTTEFRRARLTLSGKALGWEYRMEQDFAAGTNLEGLRDLFIAKNALGGKFTIGQFKPYRSMEELTSSNEILVMERPFSSATGLFNGRQFQQGVGYLRAGENYTVGLSVFNLRSAAGVRNEGVGFAGRATYAPINNDNSTLHIGGWVSSEDLNKGSATTTAVANYAGRRGPALTIASISGLGGDKITAYGAEIAGSFGPAFFQGEYVQSTYEQPFRTPDQDVTTWYLQGSWILNGGHKAYKPATGVFASPKVGDKGLWELTARYDTIENESIRNREATSLLFGVNYYVNPNLRFMFNYTQGENETNGDETGQYALRTQFSF